MEYFTEQAPTHREALQKIRTKYGERAKVLTHRTVRMGGFLGLFSKEGVELSGYLSPEDTAKSQAKPQSKSQEKVQEEKQKILENVRGESTLQKVLEEVQSLKEQMGERSSLKDTEEENEAIRNIEEVLEQNEFSRSFIAMIRDKMKSRLSMQELEDEEVIQNRVLEWISEEVPLYKDFDNRKKKILVLIGPTGVGKTTTVAKLAAIHSLGAKGERAKDVRIVTIDNYRIGAKQQMRTYADILGVPFTGVENYEDLRKTISLYKDADLILIDTIGKSPKDYMNLAKMREVLEGAGGQSEIHLAVSATTKVSDINEILKQFEPFDYSSVVLTKIDETMRVGNIVSVMWERGKKVSYVTDGQGVPDDIERAGVVRFLKTLEGFSLSPEKLREKFSEMYASSPADGGNGEKDSDRKAPSRGEGGKKDEGITADEQRHLYSYGAQSHSETAWSKK